MCRVRPYDLYLKMLQYLYSIKFVVSIYSKSYEVSSVKAPLLRSEFVNPKFTPLVTYT